MAVVNSTFEYGRGNFEKIDSAQPVVNTRNEEKPAGAMNWAQVHYEIRSARRDNAKSNIRTGYLLAGLKKFFARTTDNTVAVGSNRDKDQGTWAGQLKMLGMSNSEADRLIAISQKSIFSEAQYEETLPNEINALWRLVGQTDDDIIMAMSDRFGLITEGSKSQDIKKLFEALNKVRRANEGQDAWTLIEQSAAQVKDSDSALTQFIKKADYVFSGGSQDEKTSAAATGSLGKGVKNPKGKKREAITIDLHTGYVDESDIKDIQNAITKIFQDKKYAALAEVVGYEVKLKSSERWIEFKDEAKEYNDTLNACNSAVTAYNALLAARKNAGTDKADKDDSILKSVLVAGGKMGATKSKWEKVLAKDPNHKGFELLDYHGITRSKDKGGGSWKSGAVQEAAE